MTSQEDGPSRKGQIAKRVCEVRESLRLSIAEMASELGIPTRTWTNYEDCVTIPLDVGLSFIVRFRVNPKWLHTGEGEMFLEPRADHENS